MLSILWLGSVLMLLQVMTTFMPPPPASTYLAFHPQDNNIIAIGMEDSTIHIYNVRVDEVIFFNQWQCCYCSYYYCWYMFFFAYLCQVKTKLKGHQKRITGLAFSNNLNILVSSGADAQVSNNSGFLHFVYLETWPQISENPDKFHVLCMAMHHKHRHAQTDMCMYYAYIHVTIS